MLTRTLATTAVMGFDFIAFTFRGWTIASILGPIKNSKLTAKLQSCNLRRLPVASAPNRHLAQTFYNAAMFRAVCALAGLLLITALSGRAMAVSVVHL